MQRAALLTFCLPQTTEENLKACRPKKRRYSSYKGKISDAPENLVNRDLHADGPNVLRLTDITEFSIPAGKVYLSPIIDRFDDKVVARTISTSPNAEPVNTMLDEVTVTLKDGEHPNIPSARQPELPLSPARMGREVQALRDNQVDVEEGLQPGQLGDGGILLPPQGGVLLRSGPERPVDRAVHGDTG